MAKLRGVKAGGSAVPRLAAGAYTAGGWDHPDMRRWSPGDGSADSDLLPQQGTIRSRSRDLARNHGVAEGAIQTLTDNIVSSGLRLKSRPDARGLGWTDDQAEAWSNLVESRFAAYWDSTWVDAARSLNGHGLTKLAYGGSFVNGEGLGLALWLPRPGSPSSTCVQIVEADRLQNPNGQPDRVDLRGGIEIDAYGAPLAYWIRKTHPGERFFVGGGMFSSDSERIPARTPWGRVRVIHLHDKERAGQTRGKPQLASVMRQFKVLGDYTNAELKAAVVNAMVAIVTKSSMGQEQLVELLSSNPDALKSYQEGLAQRGRASVDFNAGMILPLALGEDFASFTPARPVDSFEPFTLALFRHIAAGLNIPYELLLKDFSKTNYSSARAALLEAWRFFRGRRKWVIANWCQPIFELWLEEEVMEGRIEAPDFYENRAFYCRTKWIGDGRGWVDPLKEAQAADMRLKTGLTTLEDECAEQGQDWEEVLLQRAREMKRAKELGISLPWFSGKPSAPEPHGVNPDDESATSDVDEPGGDERDEVGEGKGGATGNLRRGVQISPADKGAHLRDLAAAQAELAKGLVAVGEGVARLADRPPAAVNVHTTLDDIGDGVMRAAAAAKESADRSAQVAMDVKGIAARVGDGVASLSAAQDRIASATHERLDELLVISAADRVAMLDQDGVPVRTRVDVPAKK